MISFTNNRNIGYVMCLIFLLSFSEVFSQGRNSVYLLGYNAKARLNFTSNSYSISPDSRAITFNDAQGNIADENGNLLMSSNGIFIADANGDTMFNGTGINTGWVTTNYPDGVPLSYLNLFLPVPNDSNKYVLFHQGYEISSLNSPEVFYSIVDITLNNGLGAVISKNNLAISGAFAPGLTACRHANGRDWWIIALSGNGSLIHEFLLTPDTVEYMGVQNLQLQPLPGWGGQLVFSPNGEKFAFRHGGNQGINWNHFINIMDFDRCSGLFSLDTVINYSDSTIGFGTMFSPDSRYLYFSTSKHIYQVDTDVPNIASTFQTVGINDTFASPNPPFFTDFNMMYLAANGKIYISSGSSVKHLHEINYPDSAGTACDVQLHNVFTNCFYIGVPNHPNYYLGRLVGSACDTLTSVSEIEHDFKFKIFPNPITDGNFKIMYLLPQNKTGRLEIFDINGKVIYSQSLPQWSTIQNISLLKFTNGIYNCVITSANQIISRKLAIIKN